MMQKHDNARIRPKRAPLKGGAHADHGFKKSFRRSVNERKRRQALTFRR